MATKAIKKKSERKTNPNGANQYLLDPRQNTCWSLYIDPKSETFSNAYMSAMRAGYPDATARGITTQDWFLERTRRMNMLSKAERNLDEFLDLPSMTQAMGAFGPLVHKKTKKPVMTFNVGLLSLKQKSTEFVAERVGKERYGNRRGEGGDTFNLIVFANEQQRRIAERIVGGGADGSPASA